MSLENLFTPQTDNNAQNIELLAKMLEKLMTTLVNPNERLDHFTDLTTSLISQTTVLFTLGKTYNVLAINTFITALQNFLISKDRKGRLELLQALDKTQQSLQVGIGGFTPTVMPLDTPQVQNKSRWKFWRK